jgi:hypothetical protein
MSITEKLAFQDCQTSPEKAALVLQAEQHYNIKFPVDYLTVLDGILWANLIHPLRIRVQSSSIDYRSLLCTAYPRPIDLEDDNYLVEMLQSCTELGEGPELSSIAFNLIRCFPELFIKNGRLETFPFARGDLISGNAPPKLGYLSFDIYSNMRIIFQTRDNTFRASIESTFSDMVERSEIVDDEY